MASTRGVRAADDDALAVGSSMEDFGLRALDLSTGTLGQRVWLSDYVGPVARERGVRVKLLVLNFFATWCKSCVSELKGLSKLQARYRAQGLQVLSVNYREPNESFTATVGTTRKLFGAEQLTFPLLFDRYTNRNQLLYMSARSELPYNVLIDAAGILIGRSQGESASDFAALEGTIRSRLGLSEDAR